MEHDHDDQSTNTEQSTAPASHSRRDMLKLAGTVGTASIGALSLVGTAVGDEAEGEAESTTPQSTAAETTEANSFAPAAETSDEAEPLAVNPNCVWQSGTPGATIRSGNCAQHAQNNAWDYAGHILNRYPGLDNCRTQVSVWGEIKAHPCCESITIGCELK